MTPCWKLEPSNRPMFSELIENIKDMLKAHEVKQYVCVPYMLDHIIQSHEYAHVK